MTGTGGGHRAVRWLWRGGGVLPRLARALLLPLAGAYWLVMAARTAAFRRGWRRVARLPLPTVAVGNLTVGGAGKTPIAAWIAAFYAGRGRRPGVLLRGYGEDEPRVHAHLVPQAVVVPDPDRVAGAARARTGGAEVLVLDDAYQLLGVARDLNIALVAAEHQQLASWPLPAGPWREPWRALDRADVVIVTRKRATRSVATALADRIAVRWPRACVAIAHLGVTRLEAMGSRRTLGTQALAGRRILAVSGIADPESYAVQLRASGAMVQLAAYQDHHAYDDGDVGHLVRAAAAVDYVVVTEKDAVKLRERWPAAAPEPLVAVLEVQWERNAAALERALDAVPRAHTT